MWKDLLSFTRREQYGILALMILIIIFTLVRIITPYFITYPDFSEIIEDVTDYIIIEDSDIIESDIEYKIELFNPNEVTKSQLISYGISEKTSENWIKYLEKGGRFYKKEDVKKIYGITTIIYDAIYPYLKIDNLEKPDVLERQVKAPVEYINLNKADYTFLATLNKEIVDSIYFYQENYWFPNSIAKENFLKWDFDSLEKVKPFLKEKSFKREQVLIDINLADSLEWMSLQGIGPVLSKRIVNYRNKLGGFVKPEQLLEVYGVNNEVYNKIKDNLNSSTDVQRKINVNRASVYQLRQHPYISFYIAKHIVDKRLDAGLFSSVEEVYDSSIFETEEWEIIKHYLMVD